MTARLWHGYTSPENADNYEQLLREEIFPSIEQMKVKGYKAINLFRRPLDKEVEFITIMYFESLEAVKKFAGEDYEKSYVPPSARKILSRHDEKSQHYEIRLVNEYYGNEL